MPFVWIFQNLLLTSILKLCSFYLWVVLKLKLGQWWATSTINYGFSGQTKASLVDSLEKMLENSILDQSKVMADSDKSNHGWIGS